MFLRLSERGGGGTTGLVAAAQSAPHPSHVSVAQFGKMRPSSLKTSAYSSASLPALTTAQKPQAAQRSWSREPPRPSKHMGEHQGLTQAPPDPAAPGRGALSLPGAIPALPSLPCLPPRLRSALSSSSLVQSLAENGLKEGGNARLFH